MAKIFVRSYSNFAGKWIYEGYAKAFEEIGWQVERYRIGSPLREEELDGNVVMMTDSDFANVDSIVSGRGIEAVKRAKHIFLFVSPNRFPDPWGTHPNFVSQISRNKAAVANLRELGNITFWTFCNPNEYWSDWGQVEYVPLAYDHLAYESVQYQRTAEFDVCYIGSRADNGFDSKWKIMKETFAAFKDSGLKCGFFINKNLTHEQETNILRNSKVALNIHDDYQRVLGLDVNERTFKAIGINGLLVSDYGEQNKQMLELKLPYTAFPNTPDVRELVSRVKDNMNIIDELRQEKREVILANHTYVNRVKQLEAFIGS